MKRNWTWLHLEPGDRLTAKERREARKRALEKSKAHEIAAVEKANDDVEEEEATSSKKKRTDGKPEDNSKNRKSSHFDAPSSSSSRSTANSAKAATKAAALSMDGFQTREITNASAFKASRRGGKGQRRNRSGGGGGDAGEASATTPSLKMRRIRPKKPKTPYYDDKDRLALKRMTKERVNWSRSEDSLLLLCRVTSSFMDDRCSVVINLNIKKSEYLKNIKKSK